MADAVVTRITAIAATRTAREALHSAGTRLRSAIADARVFAIPTQTLDQAEPPTAPVVDLTGTAAIDAGLGALMATDYRDNQHPMATLRHPGVIACHSDCAGLVDEINSAKAALASAMAAMGTAKWQYWRHRTPAWSRLNRLQIYRAWHWLDTPVRQIGLSWAGHTHGITQLRVSALMGRLQRQYRRSGHPHIALELDRLAGFDEDEVVVIRRPIAPTPVANVAFATGARRAVKTPLPLLVRAPLPAIAPLRDFDATERNAARCDRAIEDTPLVAYWHAWRYRPPYRFKLPTNPVNARLVSIEGGRLGVRVPRKADTPIGAYDRRRLEAAVALASAGRGPVSGAPPLDDSRRARLVAVNRVHGYLVTEEPRVWRVPLEDLRYLANAQAARRPA